MSFLFGGGSKDPKDLLDQTEHSDSNKRLEAVEEIGKLDNQYPETKERLEYLKDNDSEKKVRKAANKALKDTKKKPMADALYASSEGYDDPDVPDAKEGGREGTAFEGEVGDASLEKGEMDVESSMSKGEEDRLELEAEGKGIVVSINEKNKLTLSYQGEVLETGQSTGSVRVSNSGNRNRINGIDLYLNNINQIRSEDQISDHTHIGMIKPQEYWDRNYEFDADLEVIKIEQDFLDPETNLSPNFMDGREPEFQNKITITNTLDKAIVNIRGKKILNANASLVNTSGEGVSFESGTEEVTEQSTMTSETDQPDDFESSSEQSESTRMAEVVNFTIEEIAPGETVEFIITLKASLPDDVPVYTAGALSVTYDVKEFLTSGLEFGSVDGVSDIRQRIRKKQRETEPNLYDAEVIFINESEFVYQIKEFEVRQNDIHGKPVLEWLGADATEDEREIVPGEKVAFEFVYDDVDRDGNPAFGQHLEFEVQEYHEISSEFELTLPAEDLKFMALDIKKTYLDENGEETREFDIPSYVETEIPARIWVTGIGTYPLDNVEIVEEIPEGFRFTETDQIKVFRNGQELAEGDYEVVFGDPQGPADSQAASSQEVSSTEEGMEGTEDEESSTVAVTKADLEGGSRMQINLYNLQDTEDGPFAQDNEFTVEYSIIADELEPRDDPIKTYAFTEGYINELPDSRVHDEIAGEDDLHLNVIHLRDDLDIGKYVRAIAHDGQDAYEIELEAENYGTSTQTLVIKDMIPVGFDLVENSMSSEPDIEVEGPDTSEEGLVYTWTFENVEPEKSIRAIYKLVQSEDDANPRMLQKVYQG